MVVYIDTSRVLQLKRNGDENIFVFKMYVRKQNWQIGEHNIHSSEVWLAKDGLFQVMILDTYLYYPTTKHIYNELCQYKNLTNHDDIHFHLS